MPANAARMLATTLAGANAKEHKQTKRYEKTNNKNKKTTIDAKKHALAGRRYEET